MLVKHCVLLVDGRPVNVCTSTYICIYNINSHSSAESTYLDEYIYRTTHPLLPLCTWHTWGRTEFTIYTKSMFTCMRVGIPWCTAHAILEAKSQIEEQSRFFGQWLEWIHFMECRKRWFFNALIRYSDCNSL